MWMFRNKEKLSRHFYVLLCAREKAINVDVRPIIQDYVSRHFYVLLCAREKAIITLTRAPLSRATLSQTLLAARRTGTRDAPEYNTFMRKVLVV